MTWDDRQAADGGGERPEPAGSGSDGVRLSLRLTLDGGVRLGPGKIRLLEAVAGTGSISAAARAMAMSYRRAWLLINSLNEALESPVVESRSGGRKGGGALVTARGRELIALYHSMERKARRAVDEELHALGRTGRR